MKTKFMSNNMKENKNFKRLVIFVIVATMCLSALALLPTASADCPEDCPSGMISYWKLDETSSGPVEDCYGPNDAVNNGATINQPGQVGTAYGFNGAGDYILAPSLDSQINDTLTIAAWLYTDESTPGVTNCYFRIVGLLHLRRGSGVWDLDGEGGLSDVQFSWNFDNHQQEWHYHVVTLDVSGSPPYEVRAFVDGVEEPGSPFSIAAKSTATYTNTYIGQFSSSYSWEGSIDEVAIYDRALSPEEISSQYYAGLAGHGYCECPDTVYVDDDYASSSCGGHNWHWDAFATIQEGVDAVCEGGSVYIYDGTYTEQVHIEKDLTLQGVSSSPKPVIQAPPVATRTTYTIPESGRTFDPIVFADGGTGVISVTMDNFEIDGNNDGGSNTFTGILFRETIGVISNNDLHSLKGTGQETMGLLVYGANSDMDINDNSNENGSEKE